MKYFTLLVLALLFLKVYCTTDVCTISQMKGEIICPAISTLCEIQIYYFHNPEKFPSELRDEDKRNRKIMKNFNTFASLRVREIWEKLGSATTSEDLKDSLHHSTSSRFQELDENIEEEIQSINTIFIDISKKIIPIVKLMKMEKELDKTLISFVSSVFGFRAQQSYNIYDCETKPCIIGITHSININPILSENEINDYFYKKKNEKGTNSELKKSFSLSSKDFISVKNQKPKNELKQTKSLQKLMVPPGKENSEKSIRLSAPKNNLNIPRKLGIKIVMNRKNEEINAQKIFQKKIAQKSDKNENSILSDNRKMKYKKELVLPNIKVWKAEENTDDRGKKNEEIPRKNQENIIPAYNINQNLINNRLDVKGNLNKEMIFKKMPKIKINNKNQNLNEKEGRVTSKSIIALPKNIIKEKNTIKKQTENDKKSNEKKKKISINKTGGFHFIYSIQNFELIKKEKATYLKGRDQQHEHQKLTFFITSQRLDNSKSEGAWNEKYFGKNIYIRTAHINEVYVLNHID